MLLDHIFRQKRKQDVVNHIFWQNCLCTFDMLGINIFRSVIYINCEHSSQKHLCCCSSTEMSYLGDLVDVNSLLKYISWWSLPGLACLFPLSTSACIDPQSYFHSDIVSRSQLDWFHAHILTSCSPLPDTWILNTMTPWISDNLNLLTLKKPDSKYSVCLYWFGSCFLCFDCCG